MVALVRPVRAGRGSLADAVAERLKAEIANGRFAHADVLPGERELCAMFEVSRTTLRRAIESLAEEGALSRHHGAGTFVRRGAPHIDQPLSRLTSFTEDMRLRATLLAPEEAALLQTPRRSAALEIHRIAYLGDGRCVEYTHSFYRADAYDFVAELSLGDGKGASA